MIVNSSTNLHNFNDRCDSSTIDCVSSGDLAGPSVKNGFRVATPSAPPRVLVILPYGPNRIRVRAAGALRELTGIAEVDLVSLDDGNPWELQVEVRKHT